MKKDEIGNINDTLALLKISKHNNNNNDDNSDSSDDSLNGWDIHP